LVKIYKERLDIIMDTSKLKDVLKGLAISLAVTAAQASVWTWTADRVKKFLGRNNTETK